MWSQTGVCLVVSVALCLSCSTRSSDEGGGNDVRTGSDAVSEEGGCTPDCGGKECGGDGCGGVCGDCPDSAECSEGVCGPPACTPDEPCDDGDPCTYDDACVEGVCSGTAYNCDDGKVCTEDVCDGAGNCDSKIKPGKCLIDGSCFGNGDLKPGNGCRECLSSVSKSEWSADDSNECDDGDACLEGEHCSEGECVAGGKAVECDDGNPCTDDR